MRRWGFGNAVALALAVAGCHREPEAEPPPVVDTGTLPEHARPLCAEWVDEPKVAADLVAWADAFGPSTNRFYGHAEWDALEALGADVGDTAERQVMNLIVRGWHRLKFDTPDRAIEDFERAVSVADAAGLRWRGRARELLGAAWMRKGEVDNCVTNGVGSACIVPFDDAGLHTDPTGMTQAAEVFADVLEQDLPDQLSVRWLYNVTHMARGTWPDGVPEPWRFPEDFLRSEGPSEPFVNHMPAIGFTEPALAGGAALEDFDGDGLLDILVSSMLPTDGMQLYLNMGDGDYCRASRQSGVSAITGILSFQAADYDNDGDVDVMAPRGAWQTQWGGVRPSLLRNDGEGRFEDVAIAAGVAGAAVNGPTQVVAWGDVDNDGWLDLFLGREDEEASAVGRRVSSLYRNRGDGTFEDIASSAGVVASGFVKGASFLDFDRDGDVDLYVSSLKSRDHLYENQGDGTFLDRAQELGVVEPIKSFPSAPIDYDQDGWTDLLVAAFTNNYGGGGPLDPTYFQSAEAFLQSKLGLPADPLYSETAHLYHNVGGSFVDVTTEVGLDDIHSTMGLSVGDLNMDGWPDLYFATGAPEYDALEPNVAYLNDEGRGFLDVTTDARMGHLQKGHGVSFGDADEDGDEDVLSDMGGAFPGDRTPDVIYANPSNPEGGVVRRHAVTLRLEGVRANRSAIGARVDVVTPERTFHHVVGDTGSFGNNSLQLEVALGDATRVTRVEIRWPGDPEAETVTDVPLDAIVRIREGEGIVSSAPYRRFGFVHEEHDETTFP